MVAEPGFVDGTPSGNRVQMSSAIVQRATSQPSAALTSMAIVLGWKSKPASLQAAPSRHRQQQQQQQQQQRRLKTEAAG
jgi:hypothetical protein